MGRETDTIFALATPPGKSAIAVIRISGDQAAGVPDALAAKCPRPGCFPSVHWLGLESVSSTLGWAGVSWPVAPASQLASQPAWLANRLASWFIVPCVRFLAGNLLL